MTKKILQILTALLSLGLIASAQRTGSDPAAYVATGGASHMIYLCGSFHVCLVNNPSGTNTWNNILDLTVLAGAPVAAGPAYGMVFPNGANPDFNGIVFRDGLGQIWLLRNDAGSTTWTALNLSTTIAGTPVAASNPMAYAGFHNGAGGPQTSHVVYSDNTGRIISLNYFPNLNGTGLWTQFHDLVPTCRSQSI